MRKLLLALGVLSLVLPRAAEAHFNLTMPPSIAKSTEGGKGDAPCGPDTSTTGTVTAVTGGQALTLSISETVPHPGFYRFALSTTSPPTFPADNVVKDANGMVLLPTNKTGESATADFEDPAVYPVIADHMFEHTGTAAQMFPSTSVPGQVIVPNMNCDKCTLQVIEFMAQHGTNGDSAGFFYHHCAFLKITADSSKPLFDPNASAGGAGGGSGNTGGASGAAGAAIAGGGAGGASSVNGGAGGAFQASAGSAPSSAGAAPSSSAGAGSGSAGAASATAGAGSSAAGASSAAAGEPADNGGGCSLSHRVAGSLPLVSLLLGWFALGVRRNRRG